MLRILSLLLTAVVPLSAAVLDVKDYGAKGDGRTLDTAAINRAIEAAATGGGGTVFFPPGEYLSFSIRLKSHLTLHLGPGATIVAAEPPYDLSQGYDAPEPRPETEQYQDFGHTHWHNALIWGEDLENISIVGPGRIYGRGLARISGRRDLLPEEKRAGLKPDLSYRPDAAPVLQPGPFGYPSPRVTLPAGVGTRAIALKNCRNVVFRDFTVYHGGHIAILGTGVDNWTCDNLTIDTNQDAIDIDCCVNVRVSNCLLNSPNDDALCLKSSYGLGRLQATENVTITNCIVTGYEEGTLLDGTRRRGGGDHGAPVGRIKMGTESNGGFRNITIANCVFDHCRGLAIMSVDGGIVEDITVTNLTMREVGNVPIFVRLAARLRGPDHPPVGAIRRLKISHVVAHDVARDGGMLIAGLPGHPIEDLTISDVFIDYVGGSTATEARRVVPEYEKNYPEPVQYGVLPAWAAWVRHVKNFRLDGAEFRTATNDLRPAIAIEDAVGGEVSRIVLPRALPAPRLVTKDLADFRLPADWTTEGGN